MVPRLRGAQGEIPLRSYRRLKNHEVCEMLCCDLEQRGFHLHGGIVFITDGGIVKAIRRRFGKKALHQRCTVHKCCNICSHLPERYKKEARRDLVGLA